MGNYLADKEGNVVLDLTAAAAGHVLGYQHDVFQRKYLDTELYNKYINHKAKPTGAEAVDAVRE